MAKVKPNELAPGLSDKFGGSVVPRQRKDDTTIFTSAPGFSTRVFRERQLAHQSRFIQAAAYARQAAKTEPIYTALSQNTPSDPYNLAFSDWLHAPVIHEVIRLPERIRVDATDNVLVTKVVITILNEQRQMLEQGEAKLIDDTWWEYRTFVPIVGNLVVEAFDLAGNITKYEPNPCKRSSS